MNLADPDCVLDALLDHRLTALTRQLNLVLSQGDKS